jgi:hypothetical protein
VRKKSAFSRSILLTTTIVLSSRSLALVQTRSVPTATPDTADTTTRAPSAAAIAPRISPTKSA